MDLSGPVLGVALGTGASLCWAVANIAIHRASRLAGDVVPLLWGQGIGALVLLLALPTFPPVAPFDAWGWLLLGGLASGAGYIGVFRAFALGPVSVMSPIIASWALVSAALGVVVFDEALPPLRALGAVLVIGGVAVIAGRREPGAGSGWAGPRWRALAAALASALGFGLMVAAMRPVGGQLGPVASILAVWGVQWILLLPYALRATGGHLLPPRAIIPTLLVLGVSEAVGFLLVDIGTLRAPISVVAPTASTAALITVFLGRALLGEAVGWDRVILAGVVVLGIALLAVG